MKSLLLHSLILLLFVSGFQSVYSQDTLTIGNGISGTFTNPVYVYSPFTNRYSNYICLYKASEMGNMEGFLKSLAWNKSDTVGYTNGDAELRIYMKHTTNQDVATIAGTFAYELNGATLVYENTSQNLNESMGWQYFDFDNLFYYNGFENLEILVDWYYPGSATGNAIRWYWSNPGTTMCSAWYGFTPFPSTTPGSNGQQRSDIKLIYDLPFTNDIGAIILGSPVPPSSPGMTNIDVSIKNYGSTPITSCDIKWSVDNSVPVTYNWNGTLAPLDTSALITVGSYDLITGSHEIKVWTENPNLVTDDYFINDTLTVSIYTCAPLNGTYSIGGVSPDFSNLTDAAFALNNCGITGPVVFQIADGTYNEQILLNEIPGADASNTITFESASGDSSSVIITWNAVDFYTNYLVKLNATDYVTFRNLTFQTSGASVYQTAIVLEYGACNNTFTSNQIIGKSGPTTAINYALVVSQYYDYLPDEYNTFQSNLFLNGSMAIYMEADYDHKERMNVFSDNVCSNQYYQPVKFYYQNGLTVDRNTIISNTTENFPYGIYLEYVDNFSVQQNKIDFSQSNGGYAIRLSLCNFTAGNYGIIANNFLHVNTTGFGCYGLDAMNCDNIKIYNNSFNLTGIHPDSKVISLISYSNNNSIVNNILCNSAGGKTIEIDNISNFTRCDHNNHFTNGPVVATWQGTSVANLSEWQSISSLGSGSIFTDPFYFAENNLHTGNILLDGMADVLPEITTDFDNEIRDPSTPDIGADEFVPPSTDLALSGFLGPFSDCGLGANEILGVSVFNAGADPISSFSLSYTINAMVYSFENVTQTINSGETIDFYFTSSADFSSEGQYDIVFAIDLIDANDINDSLMVSITNLPIIASYPLSEDFESATVGSPGTLANGWTRYPETGYTWWVDNDGTPPYDTGPEYDHTIGTLSGKFIYTESSNGSMGSECMLISPCLDFNGYDGIEVGFWYYVFGASIDTIHVDVYSDGSWKNDVFFIAGEQQTFYNQPWLYTSFRAAVTPDIVKVRFRTKKTGTKGDHALDDITISRFIIKDAGVTSVNSPASSCFLSGSEPVEITVSNLGTSDFVIGDTIYLNIEIDNNPVQLDTIVLSSDFISGTSFNYIFNYSFDFSTVQQYSVTAYSSSEYDFVPENDTTYHSIEVYGNALVDLGPDIAVCDGMQVVLDAGAGMNTYEWNNSGTDQTTQVEITDSYSVTITDNNGCTGSDTVGVLFYANPQTTITPEPAEVCAGADLQLNGNPIPGDGAVITNYWLGDNIYLSSDLIKDPVFSSDVPAIYTLIYNLVDDNDCSSADTIQIAVFANPQVSVEISESDICVDVEDYASGNVTEGDGAIALTEWSGDSQYLDDPAISNVVFNSPDEGYFTLIFTAIDIYGCIDSDTGWITTHPNPGVFLGNDTSVCAGQWIELDAGFGYTEYYWNNGSNAQNSVFETPSTIAITVYDSYQCMAVDSIIVDTLPVPVFLFAEDTIVSDVFVIDAGSGYSTYLWMNGSTDQSILADTTGWYSIVVGNEYGCLASDSVFADIITNLKIESSDIRQLKIYPNPSDGIFSLSIGNEDLKDAELLIYDQNGRIVRKDFISGSRQVIHAERFDSGVYYVVVKDGSKTHVGKVILK